ncbi:protein yippee-like At4g27745 [Andrographis paniculata]|uniref:protein yippee-like At4g27745 n=1 Tax=Andrographis paniculata TaxID=175694 RepID=UPI0021E93453|nr:protein yippee-like At4g27745 [Andrographis paniculata]
MDDMAEVSAALPKTRIYSCCNCKNLIAFHNQIIPGDFQGRHGSAFLFSHAMNIRLGRSRHRKLTTGEYILADIYCEDCNSLLGWKFLLAEDDSEKYKEGNFLLDTSKVAEVEDED